METLNFKDYKSLNESKKMRLSTIYRYVPSLKDKLRYNDVGELVLYDDMNFKFTLPDTFSGFLNKYFEKNNNHTIPITIDKVVGNFNMALYSHIYNFPKKIIGYFQVANCRNIDLETFPEIVEGYYSVDANLYSLAGGPKYVGGDFICGRNRLLTLAGFTGVVNGDFYTKTFGYLDDDDRFPTDQEGHHGENCLISKAHDGTIKGKLKTDKIITYPHAGVVYILKNLSDEMLEFHYRFLERHFDITALNVLDECLKICGRNLPFIKDPKVDHLRQIKNKTEDTIGFSF